MACCWDTFFYMIRTSCGLWWMLQYSLKTGEFVHELTDCWLLKYDSIARNYLTDLLSSNVGCVETKSIRCWPLFDLVYQPRLIDDDECVAVYGMKIESIKSIKLSFSPSQISHDLTWTRTWDAAVRNRRLTACATAVLLSHQALEFPSV
jgi:hypothetical protein